MLKAPTGTVLALQVLFSIPSFIVNLMRRHHNKDKNPPPGETMHLLTVGGSSLMWFLASIAACGTAMPEVALARGLFSVVSVNILGRLCTHGEAPVDPPFPLSHTSPRQTLHLSFGVETNLINVHDVRVLTHPALQWWDGSVSGAPVVGRERDGGVA